MTSLQSLRRVTGLCVGLVGALVLLGWLFNVAALKSLLPGLATMKANTAVCFLLAGAALVLWRRADDRAWRGRVVRLCAAVIALVGLSTLGEYGTGRSLGLDELLFRETPLAPMTSHPGRMGLNTALAFVLSGAAFWLARAKDWRAVLAQAQALAVGWLGFIALVGYSYSLIQLMRFASYSGMAAHTALCFVVLALGLLSLRPEAGVMRLVMHAGLAGTVLRRLLPAVLLTLLLLDWLIEQGVRRGWYGEEWNLYAVMGVAVMSWLIWRFTRLLAELEALRDEANAARHQLDAQMHTTLRSVGDAVIATDAQGRITFLNAVAAELTGWTPEQASGAPVEEVFRIVNETTRATVESPVEQVLRTGRSVVLANHTILLTKDGRELPLDDSGAPIRDAAGKITGVVLTFRDISERKAAEQARARLAAIVESSQDAMVTVSLDGKFLTWNAGAQRLFGYTAAEVIGQPVTLFIPDDKLEEARQLSARRARGETIPPLETVRLRKDGTRLDVSLSVSPLTDAEGQVRGSSAVLRDIRARKQAEAAQAQLAAIVASSDDAIVGKNLAGVITSWNQGAEKLFGYTAAEAIGQPVTMLIPPPRHDEEAGILARIRSGQSIHHYETVRRKKDGTELNISLTVSPVRDGTGQIIGASKIARDVSARKQAEAELLGLRDELAAEVAAMNRLHALSVELATAGSLTEVYEKTLAGVLELHAADFGNLQLYDAAAGELRIVAQRGFGQEFLDYFRVVTVADASACARALKTGERIVIGDVETDAAYAPLCQIAAAAGYRAVQSTPLRARDGTSLGIVSTHFRQPRRPSERALRLTDLLLQLAAETVHRRQAEARLSASEQQLELVSNTVPALIFYLDAERRYQTCNEGFTKWFGVSRDAVLGQRVRDFVGAAAWQVIEPWLTRAYTGEAVEYEAEAPYRLGGMRWIHAAYTPHRDDAGTVAGVVVLVTDITERKAAEAALAESRARLAATYTNAPIGIVETTLDGRFLNVNDEFCRLVGYSRAELLARRIEDLTFADDRPRNQQLFAQLATGDGAASQLEKRYVRQDGTLVWVDVHRALLKDAQGRPAYVIGAIVDISERKQIEAERERLLREAQRLREVAEAHNRAKDEFLAVVTHELRNPLNAILGYTRLMRVRPDDAEQVARHCDIVERSARAQQSMIDDLLDTARIVSGKLTLEIAPADARQVLEDALAVVRPAAAAKHIALATQLGAEPLELFCDAARLRQIAWNLLQNAIKFTPDGGRITLRLARAGPRVQLSVTDTGQGIAPEFLPAVFDRFSQDDMSRTRRQGGLGLGLALVKQLVELHGGTIAATSAGVGQGATFTVTLPLRAPPAASVTPPRAVAVLSQGDDMLPLTQLPRLDGLRVLVVDDQADARQLLADTLHTWGAAITTAASGPEARACCAAQSFDLLVCDIAMPGEDGYQLLAQLRAAEQARGLAPAQRLPAVALTALVRAEDRLRALNAGFQTHVAKPIELAELILVIASLTRNRHATTTVQEG